MSNGSQEKLQDNAAEPVEEIRTEEEEASASALESSEETAQAELAEDQQQYAEEPQDAEEPQKVEESQAGLTLEQALAQLDEARTEKARARDDLLRVQAEMQNLRRRTDQNIEKAHKFGQEKFSTELLQVVDNLERALEAASGDQDERVKAIYEGVELTHKSLIDCFQKNNIKPVDPEGEPFDPALHQAVTLQENADVEPNTVLQVMQRGYTLHGRVIRPAMVMVSKAASTESTES